MTLTHFFAQFIGLFCLVIGASILFQKKVFVEVVNDIIRSAAVLYTLGIISLFLGLFVVLTHNIWNAGFLPFVVTLIGWLMVLKGIFGMFLSRDTVARGIRSFNVQGLSWFYALVVLVIGVYLTYAGFAG